MKDLLLKPTPEQKEVDRRLFEGMIILAGVASGQISSSKGVELIKRITPQAEPDSVERKLKLASKLKPVI